MLVERLVRNRRFVRATAVALLAIHTGLLGYSATRHSPTYSEPAFLVAGLSHWKFGRFDLYRVNPPLTRMVAALPVLAAGCETDWSRFHEGPGTRAEFPVGQDFIKANGGSSIRLFIYARWACIPFSLIGAYFVYRWANDLYGAGAALVTLTLYCFEPNLLAHAELITPDCACTSFGIAAGYYFWKWLKQPSSAQALAAGLFLGLAELSKMSWLILFGLWPLLWIGWCFFRNRLSPSSSAMTIHSAPMAHGLQLAGILLLGLYVLNLGYALDGTFTKLKNFTFVSRLMTGLERSSEPGNRFMGTWLGELPVPVPRHYLLGFDTQKRDFEDYSQLSYLRGQWKQGGWWYYYLCGLLIKIPCGTWFLFGAVSCEWLMRKTRRVPRCDELILLAPATALFMLVSSQTAFNHHLRYVFPTLGLLLIFLGRGFFLLTSSFSLVRLPVALMTGYSLLSALLVYPHSLSYFNELVSGPNNGHRYLDNSSIDWGQDLLFLQSWYRKHPDSRPFFLAYHGCVNPALTGMDFDSPPLEQLPQAAAAHRDLPAGWYGVSATFLQGRDSSVFLPDGSSRFGPSESRSYYFNELEPVDRAGYSIMIYYVREPPAR